MSGQATVEVEGIRKSFSGVEVLHGVDLTADAGSVLALLGENGAGKSTLMKILVGDYPPDAGRVTFAGEDITGATPAQARDAGISMVFQELSDAPPLTVSREHLPRPVADTARPGRLVRRPPPSGRRARHPGVRHRPRPSGRHAAHR